jgi:eukaryotic-like serine/threonine-protein kinase
MPIDLRQWDSAQEMFEDALAKNPAERTTYLETASPSDEHLRRDVLRMIALHEQDPAFLETPMLQRVLVTPRLDNGDFVDGRFQIVRCLGVGGMGEVYEALDVQHPDHPERVAVKIVRPGLTRLNDLSLLLRRDIQLAHRVTHPNVCKVHFLDVDKRPDGDLIFLVMDYLEGETLQDRLKRDGPLDERTALSLAEQIAAGVDEAHREGVIHRDLKSSNIMLVPRKDGTTRAVITDFGIAASENEELTLGVGSLDYMAPERLTDAGATRAADIYSFGVLLYEMVTGQLPFASGTPLDHRRTLPAAPRRHRATLARRWDRAVLRCLDPSPEQRFERATLAVQALRPARWPRRVAALALAAALAWPIANVLIDRAARSRFTGPPTSVSILPFDIDAGAQIQAGLIDFLAARMQSNPLVRSAWLVFSPGDARQMGVTTPTKAAAVFGATHALVGRITGDRTSVTVDGRLVETATGRVSGTFTKTCPIENEMCLQNGMLLALSSVLDARGIAPQESPRISKDALPSYFQGMEYLRRDSVSYDFALDRFRQALAIDPSAVMPQIGLAEAYVQRYQSTGDPMTLREAESVLQAALPANPNLPELHGVLGTVRRLQGRYDAATRELLTAAQADPSNHIFQLRLGEVYAAAGQDADAQSAFDRVIALQPRYWGGYVASALFHYSRARFDEAARLLEQLIQWAPDHAQALANLGSVYLSMGRPTDAESVSRRACALTPMRVCYVNLGMALQRQRRTEEALVEYERALAFGSPSETHFLNVADAYAYLGKRTEATDYFRRAITIAEARLRDNLQNSGLRAILAYSLAQVGESSRARFEIEQALQHSPSDRTVRRYAVLTYESLGERDRAFEILRGSPSQVLEELEVSWGTEQMRRDPRYDAIATEVRSR